MGVLPIPAEGQSFADSYRQAALYGEFTPVWGRPTPFYGMAEDLAGEWGQLTVVGLIHGNGMFPLVHLSFIGPDMSLAAPPGMAGATLADPAWRSAYKAAALDVVRACRPAYLSLGNEVNRWYEKYGAREGDGNGFGHFISLYGEVYDAVKALSPRTAVFCTFAREIVSENRPADLGVLRLFPAEKMDLLVFTTYPHAVRGIRRPADIPADYHSSALSFMAGKPLGFSEAGWPALDALGGPEAQAAFLMDLTGRLTRDQGVDVRLLGWPWLHDLDPGDTMGLIQRNGTPRPAYQVWAELAGMGR